MCDNEGARALISDDYIAGSTISSYSKEENRTGKLMITARFGLRFPFGVNLTETQSRKNDPDKKWWMKKKKSALVLTVLHGEMREGDFPAINHSVLNSPSQVDDQPELQALQLHKGLQALPLLLVVFNRA